MNAKQKQIHGLLIFLESLDVRINEETARNDQYVRSRMLKDCVIELREAAQGHARYEALRLLNPQQFAKLWSHALLGRNFDELVDEIVKAKNELK